MILPRTAITYICPRCNKSVKEQITSGTGKPATMADCLAEHMKEAHDDDSNR